MPSVGPYRTAVVPQCSVPMVYKHEPICEPFLKAPQAKQWICRIGSADQEEADRLRSRTWQNPAQISGNQKTSGTVTFTNFDWQK